MREPEAGDNGVEITTGLGGWVRVVRATGLSGWLGLTGGPALRDDKVQVTLTGIGS